MGQSNLRGITLLRNILFLVIIFVEVTLSFHVFASSFTDSVLIGGTGAADSKAQLEVKSTTKGVLVPRMTTTQQNAITSPTEGLLIYDNVLHQLSNYNGTAWTAVGGAPAAATTSTLGTVKALGAVSHQFLTGITSGTGVPTQAQPAFSDLTGTCTVAQGCPGLTSATLGDIIYSSATNTWSALAGNTTTTKKFLSQTGTGSAAAAPAWGQPLCSDISNAVASCSTDTTNAANISSGVLPIARGGTNNGGLSVTVGGMPYFTGTSFGSIAPGTAGQLLASQGGTAPAWTSSTFPSSSGTAGKILRSDGTNYLTSTATFPDTAAAGTILAAGTSNTWSASATPTLGASGTTGKLNFSGTTSGTVTIQPQSAAGTYNFNLPITAGSAGNFLTSQGGVSTAMTWTSVVPIAAGGTNNGSLAVTAGGTLYTDGSKIVNVGAGSSGQFLQSNGASPPTWTTASSSLIATYDLLNCSIATSVAANALTVALKDSSGADPSGGSPCKIAFRNATAATGTPSEVSATVATSVVVSSGSALGCTASVSCIVYVYAINNAGTIEMAVIGQVLLDDGALQTSTAEGGAGAADSSGVLYSTAARATVPARLLGRIKITPGASFTWTTNSTEIANVPFTTANPVTSNATATMERIERINITCVASPTLNSQSGSWVSGVVRNSTGSCSLTVNSGIFSAAPTCIAHLLGTGAVLTDKGGTSPSVTNVKIVGYAAGGAATDYTADIICMGPR
jgi:hypothetical protein